MKRFLHCIDLLPSCWRCCLTALLLLGLTGCAGWGVKEDGFHEHDLSKTAQTARGEKAANAKDKNANYSGLTEKGRQIERDLNAM
jgi:hypothetical protein